MELPSIGKHCCAPSCNKLDFLPIKCDACQQIYCNEHYSYNKHSCSNAYTKNNQVPVCPLCNSPVPVPQGQQPDAVVGLHIDNDCKASEDKPKIFRNKCNLKGCKNKELVPLLCPDCNQNFCLRHRHTVDHQCSGRRNLPVSHHLTQVHGSLSEDEALAKAIALSMEDNGLKNYRTQEELDLALARQLEASERATTVGGSRNRDRCTVS